MRQRSIYVNDELWRQVKMDAASRGITNSQVVTNALDRYFMPPQTTKAMPKITTAEEAEQVMAHVGELLDHHLAVAAAPFTPVPKPTTSKRKATR